MTDLYVAIMSASRYGVDYLYCHEKKLGIAMKERDVDCIIDIIRLTKKFKPDKLFIDATYMRKTGNGNPSYSPEDLAAMVELIVEQVKKPVELRTYHNSF